MEIGKIQFGPNDSQLKHSQRTLRIAPPSKEYEFAPQDDITPLEAVWVAHFLARGSHLSPYPHWQIIKRHFTEVK